MKAFMPDRTNRIWGKLRVSKESVLETRLDVQDMSLTAYKHSGFGTGFRIAADDMVLYDNEVDRKKPIPKVKRPSGAVDFTRNLGAYILDFVSPSEPSRSQVKRKNPNQERAKQTERLEVLRQIGCPLVGPRGQTIVPFTPSCSSLDAAKRNPKQHFESKKVSDNRLYCTYFTAYFCCLTLCLTIF
jgi:hypothetical protein